LTAVNQVHALKKSGICGTTLPAAP